jgi:hypothetical protein
VRPVVVVVEHPALDRGKGRLSGSTSETACPSRRLRRPTVYPEDDIDVGGVPTVALPALVPPPDKG